MRLYLAGGAADTVKETRIKMENRNEDLII
jgi:hypothetical protein